MMYAYKTCLWKLNICIGGNSTLSLRSTMFIILGQYNYDDLRRVNRYLAPLYVMSYVALVGYGLINLFLAIMTQSYDRLRQMYFDDYVQSEKDKLKEHLKSVGTIDGGGGNSGHGGHGGHRGGGKKESGPHMSLTPWQALISLIPLLKDVKKSVHNVSSGY